MEHQHQESLLTHKTVTILSFVVSAYYSIFYLGGRHGLGHDHPFHAGNTPFTANIFFIFSFWVVLTVLQLLFLVQFYAKDSRIVAQASSVTWHFTLFNLLQAYWAYLFSRKSSYWAAEVVVVLNFINVMSLYITHKPYAIRPLSHWLAIHIPTTAMPLAWLLYTIFWNGAVMLHVHRSLVGRVLANILVWEFLAVPALFLILYRDWGFGLASSFLTWGLGVGQFFTRVIALQWVFAFIIAGLVFVLSIIVAVPSLAPAQLEAARQEVIRNEQAAVLQRAAGQSDHASNETAPLLA